MWQRRCAVCAAVLLFISFLWTIVLGTGPTPGPGQRVGSFPDIHVPPAQVSFFTENKGQWSDDILFLADTSFGNVGLGRDRIYYHIRDLPSQGSFEDQITLRDPHEVPHMDGPTAGCVIKYVLECSKAVSVRGENELPHSTNYFLGNDDSRWAINVKSYRSVVYEDLWNDVDMVFHFGDDKPKYDIILGTEADIEDVRIRVEGHQSISFKGSDLKIEGPGTYSLSDTGLMAYEAESSKEVEVSYRMLSSDTFGFSLPNGQRDGQVIIDPWLVATYLGGGNMDYGYSSGVDADGNIIVFGWTYSSDFPTTPGAYDRSLGGTGDIYVSKLDWTGSSLIFSTYIGGSGYDYYYYYGGMAVLDDGILVSCITSSNDYPTTSGCYDSTLGGGYDAAFSKLSLDGSSLLISSYFGGSSYEYAYDVAASADGGFYLLGSTYSSDLPITSGAFQSTMVGTTDCFVARFSSDGKTLEASTFIGGSSSDYPQRVREDPDGNIVICGSAYSPDFPVKTGCYDTTHNGGTGDCFVSVIQDDCKTLLASTFLGGPGSDIPHAMDIDPDGNIIVFGFTTSSGFPTTSGVYQGTYVGGGDAFVTVMDPGLKEVVRSTFFGGTGDDSPVSIGLDAMGNIVIAGTTVSSNMPTTPDAEDRTHNGGQDFFLGILSGDLSELSYSTYCGGSGLESGGELCIDPLGKIVVVGKTNSTDMPVTDLAYQKEKQGSIYYSDIYIFGLEHFTASEPIGVDSVRTYSDANYTVESRSFDLEQRVYVELKGTDSNASRRDGAMVNVSSASSGTELLYRVLVETDKNSGVFRGSFLVPSNSAYLDALKVVSRKDPSKGANILIDYPFRPTFVSTLSVHEDLFSSATIDKADLGQTVFFKAFGMDANPLTRDKAFVNLTSDRDPTLSLLVVLSETDQASGLYQGSFTVPMTMAYYENITITSVETPTRYVVFMVHTPVRLRCTIDHTLAIEDEHYNAVFWNFGYNPVSWSVTKNAYWLDWEPDVKSLSGTPKNLDVGETEVTLTIWDDFGHSEEWSFKINVRNVPPKILTKHVVTALEDEEYSVIYESDDDPGGMTSWFLTTNAKFLSMNKRSGELKGRPINDDVGTYFLSIDVQDGNGGNTNERFNLTVMNVNDRPMITTSDIRTVLQDDRFVRDYDAFDEDLNETQFWELRTDAKWLTMDNITGVLSGTPRAWDVGYHTVNITVTDSGGLWDSREFRLEVLDKKDKPFFVDYPSDTELVHGERFYFDVNATDHDVGDKVEYSISKCDPPSDIAIDPDTGIIDWVASIHFLTGGKDRYNVTLKASDGELFSTVDFELKIIPTLPPRTTLQSPQDGSRTSSAHSVLRWTGEDPEGDEMSYTVYLHRTLKIVTEIDEEAVRSRDIHATSLNLTELEQGATYYWTVIPYDGCTYGTCISGTLSFRVNNRPSMEQMEKKSFRSGTRTRMNVIGNDLDTEDTLHYVLTSAPDGMVIENLTGSITWTPSDDQVGEWTVKVRVSDGTDHADMSFFIIVEKGSALDATLFIVISVFVIMSLIIIALVLIMVFKVRKLAPEPEAERPEEDADRIAREIEELEKERDWDREHATGEGESKTVTISLEGSPSVPTSPMEAHLHDKDRVKPTYEDLYGAKMPEESEEQMDKVLKEGLEEMDEEEPEESWE